MSLIFGRSSPEQHHATVTTNELWGLESHTESCWTNNHIIVTRITYDLGLYMLFNDGGVDFASLPSSELFLRLNCCGRLVEDSVSHLD